MSTAIPTLLALLLPTAGGDRWFAKEQTIVRRAPATEARPVRGLLVGDELVELEPPEDALVNQRAPRGWLRVQTVDTPSGRSFAGWVESKSVRSEPPAPAQRIATLRSAVEEALNDLETRQKPFGDLRDQVHAWQAKEKDEPTAAAQAQALADRLAQFMEAEIAPRALDIQDAIEELKELGDPKLASLQLRFGKLAQGFKP